MSQQVVGYIRVSTARQGKSGLGLEAQREALARFAAAGDLEIVAEYLEVETGKGSDALDRRPELAAALADARRLKCPIIVAKLGARPDRRRDRAFVVRVAASGGLCEGEQLQEVVGGADHGPLGRIFFRYH